MLEVLIATAIMVIVLGAMVYGLSQCSNLTQTVHNQDIAMNAVQQKLEEIANSDISQIISNYDGQTFTVNGLNNPVDPTDPTELIDHGQVAATPLGVGDLFDVTVTVSWRQKGSRQITRALTTTLVNK